MTTNNIIERTNKKGEVTGYQAQIRVAGQKSISRTFKTCEKAIAYLTIMEPKVRAKQLIDRKAATRGKRAKAPGLQELLNEKMTDILTRFKTASSGHRYNKYGPAMFELLGETRVCDLKKAWAEKYRDDLRVRHTCYGRPHKWATVAMHFKILAYMCRWRAEALDVPCPKLPFSMTLLPKGWDEERSRRLSKREERRIRAELHQMHTPAAPHYAALFDFALETGARLSEIVNAPWSEFDLERQGWFLPAERTKCSRSRQIPLSPRAVEILESLARDPDPLSPRVFHRLPPAQTVSIIFHKVVKRCGVENFRFHDLRHEAVTRLCMSGIHPVPAIMLYVGHRSPKTFLRYMNPTVEELAKSMRAPDAGIGRAVHR